MRLGKTQTSAGWSDSSLSAWSRFESLVDAQADLSLRWALIQSCSTCCTPATLVSTVSETIKINKVDHFICLFSIQFFLVLTLLTGHTKKIPVQTMQFQMRRPVTSRLIRIYTMFATLFLVLHWINYLCQLTSKFKAGRDHLRNSGLKGLNTVSWSQYSFTLRPFVRVVQWGYNPL